MLERQGADEQLLDNVLAKRSGDDLQLSYRDRTQVTLEGYCTECKALLACDITLPGAVAKGYKPDADSAAGATLGDGSHLVYAHGAAGALMAMAQGPPALQAALAGLQGEQVTWLPMQGAWTLPLALMGGAAALIFLGKGDTTAPAMLVTPMNRGSELPVLSC